MAGPWFTVHESGGDWKTLDKILVSDGAKDIWAQVEARVRLIEEPPAR